MSESGLRPGLYTFPRYVHRENNQWRKSGSCTREREHPDTRASGIVATVFSRFLRSSALTQREEILHPYPGALSARVSLPEGGTKARRTDDAKSVARSGAGRIVASKYAHFFFPFSLSLSLSLSFDHCPELLSLFLMSDLISFRREQHVTSVRPHSN